MDDLLIQKEHENDYIKFFELGNVADAIKTFNDFKNSLEVFYKENNYTEGDISKEILALIKSFIRNLNFFGDKYMENENYDNAVLCYSEILKYLPKDIKTLSNYVICLYKTGHFETQNKVLNYLLEIIPKDDYKIYRKLVQVYSSIDDFEKFTVYLKKYIKKCPKNVLDEGEYAIIGKFYKDLFLKSKDIKYCHKAKTYLKKGLLINNNSVLILEILQYVYLYLNENNSSIDCAKKLLKLGINSVDNMMMLSYALFKNKNFKDFYKYFDYRLKQDEALLFLQTFVKNKPQWKGEDLSDKILLIFCGHGFGDTILMSGYIPRLSKLAKKVVFLVQAELYELFKDNDWDIEIISANSDFNIDFDYYMPSMSIMSVLNLDETNISVGAGYIKADKELVQIYKDKYFNNDKLKIGISLSGKTTYLKNGVMSFRNIPTKEFLPLDDLDNIELYVLQKDLAEGSFKDFKRNNVNNLSDKLSNFNDTAAFIENCDLIISSDNVILNLAGAMGKKTFGIFNWYFSWRWYDLTGEDVGWYTSVKPFVNTSMNDWQSSMTSVIEEIKKILKERFS